MAGLELARVTVINDRLEVAYDTLVKPTFPVIDYNTRYASAPNPSFRLCHIVSCSTQPKAW